jgi:hypothetical protein
LRASPGMTSKSYSGLFSPMKTIANAIVNTILNAISFAIASQERPAARENIL